MLQSMWVAYATVLPPDGRRASISVPPRHDISSYAALHSLLLRLLAEISPSCPGGGAFTCACMQVSSSYTIWRRFQISLEPCSRGSNPRIITSVYTKYPPALDSGLELQARTIGGPNPHQNQKYSRECDSQLHNPAGSDGLYTATCPNGSLRPTRSLFPSIVEIVKRARNSNCKRRQAFDSDVGIEHQSASVGFSPPLSRFKGSISMFH